MWGATQLDSCNGRKQPNQRQVSAHLESMTRHVGKKVDDYNAADN